MVMCFYWKKGFLTLRSFPCVFHDWRLWHLLRTTVFTKIKFAAVHQSPLEQVGCVLPSKSFFLALQLGKDGFYHVFLVHALLLAATLPIRQSAISLTLTPAWSVLSMLWSFYATYILKISSWTLHMHNTSWEPSILACQLNGHVFDLLGGKVFTYNWAPRSDQPNMAPGSWVLYHKDMVNYWMYIG